MIDGQHKFAVSFIVLTYNSSFGEIKKTLESVLSQKGLDYEVIIADDGSVDSHEGELNSFFADHQFNEYSLVMNKTNMGTVKNLLSGLKVSNGYYIKTVSPGDRIVDDDQIVKKWISFLERKGLNWSFSDAIYYKKNEHGKEIIVKAKAHPQDIQPYLKNNDRKSIWNYVILNDIALGATLICKASIMKDYIALIANQGVIFAEDNIWRLLMFEGDIGGYYSEATVLYECSSGISNIKTEVWENRLRQDWKTTDRIILLTASPNRMQKNMIRVMRRNDSFVNKLFVRGKVFFSLKTMLHPRMTKSS